MPRGVEAIVDVNGVGIPDLVNSWVYVALGEGNGKFKPPVLHPVQVAATGFGPGIVVPAHLRSPKLVDLVVQGAGAVSVLLNVGKGDFKDGVWTPLPSPGYCAAAADFNGDGKPDVPNPARVRSLFNERSNSASAAIMCKTSRPPALSVAIGSDSDRKLT